MNELSTSETVALATRIRGFMASSGLPPPFAKLYSQYTRLQAGQKGLTGWASNEAAARLDNALRLLDASLIEREAGIENWTDGVRRAGELLEWLSHPSLNNFNAPLRLLSAATYQLAGYPARATGILNESDAQEGESQIIHSLLKADFAQLFRILSQVWGAMDSAEIEKPIDSKEKDKSWIDQLQKSIVREVSSCLGIVCAHLRWGTEPRLNKALEKLRAIGKALSYEEDYYSWLLAKLCSEVTAGYIQNSIRNNLEPLSSSLSPTGKQALERYLRVSYETGKALVWPSQISGINKLASGESFALCTPTGSGKTAVAELAILHGLFTASNKDTEAHKDENVLAPLSMYLVPSRALATEVESKLSRVLGRLSAEQEIPVIVVTGLYGGTDWGPTDAWLTSNSPTVLICTYEKAEALVRFLGPLFLNRVSLVVIDEAHHILFSGDDKSLQSSDSRSLRLEILGTRLLYHLKGHKSRVVALSAVAAQNGESIASWVTGESFTQPVKTYYRSTRQLIGRLNCLPNQRYEIHYDLLDGADLRFDKSSVSTPYIPDPFPPHPQAKILEKSGPQVRLRPYLLWAAMHLAAPDNTGKQHSVLISISDHIENYTSDFLTLLNSIWKETPAFFTEPTEASKKETWRRCLLSCEDYFSKDSIEYQLLQKGIVIHHGKMPGLMARLLVEVVQERIVHLVIATSTLSDGVNLPFETVLIPSLQRGKNAMSIAEFGNLIGRAGRPGSGTEGRTLVLLQPESQSSEWSIKNANKMYRDLIEGLTGKKDDNDGIKANSPLSQLMKLLGQQWSKISGSKDFNQFTMWLEQTAPLEVTTKDDNISSAIQTLDSLDSFILSAIVEIEQIAGQEISSDELEENLKRVWQCTFAHFTQSNQATLERLFLVRGRAVKEKIYPNQSKRRQIYRTSLTPRASKELLDSFESIKEVLREGNDYISWEDERKFLYIQNVVLKMGSVSKFSLQTPKDKVSWNEILLWWLAPQLAKIFPTQKKISVWHSYVSQNFIYRFNWGLGSIIGLAIDESHGGILQESNLESWPKIDLPWIVLWLKEIITWGTLEPVAAYFLAKGKALTRQEAENAARVYYNDQPPDILPNDILNPVSIRNWTNEMMKPNIRQVPIKPPEEMSAQLIRDFKNTDKNEWRVVPVELFNALYWYDSAGFILATSEKPKNWQSKFLDSYDFILNSQKETVQSSLYI